MNRKVIIYLTIMEPRCKSTVRRHHFLSYFVNLSRCCGGVYYCLEHCFGSLRFAGICVCIALLKWHHISVKVKSGLWLRHWNTWILFFFRRSAVVLGIIILFGTGFSCWTDGLKNTLVYRGQLNECEVPGSCDRKTSPDTHLSTTVLDSWYGVLLQTWCCIL